jgi:hypothetical protein
MTRTAKCGLSGALVGACLALWLTVLSNLLPWRYFYNNHLLTMLAPPTVFLKIFGSPGLRLFILVVVIAQNAILYGILGLILGKVWSTIQPEPQSE